MTTLEQLQAYLADDNNRLTPTRTITYGDDETIVYKSPLKPIECADGYTLSVQANENAYCTPRNNNGPWTHVEVWRCGNVPEFEFSAAYPTGGEEPYAQVPLVDVALVIDQHGGFKNTAS